MTTKNRGRRYTGVSRYLLDAGGRWTMGPREILPLFGLEHKIPADFSATKIIQGVEVRILPKTRRGMEIRTWCVCPECPEERLVAVGHLHQHIQWHDAQREAALDNVGAFEQAMYEAEHDL